MHDASTTDPDRLLTPPQAAKFLSLSPRWLELKRYNGDGPQFVRVSARCVRYRLSDLEEWVGKRVRLSTSDIRDDES